LDETNAFIEDCKRCSGRILIHCNQGRSRSASVVVGYLMKANRWSYDTALQHLRSKRPACLPNTGFQEQLLEYEEKLFGTRLSSGIVIPKAKPFYHWRNIIVFLAIFFFVVLIWNYLTF